MLKLSTIKEVSTKALLFTSIGIVAPELAFAGEVQVFGDQIGEIESLVTGGLLRVGLLAVCGLSAAISIFRQNFMGFIIAIAGGLMVNMMSTWIKGTFGALVGV